MPGRNLAKPFSIAGFILAEIYMLFTVLGPYGHETQPLPMPPLTEAAVPAGTPAPTSAKVTRVLICAVFFGPFGALVGMGVGLLVSGALGDFRPKTTPTAGSLPGGGTPPSPQPNAEGGTTKQAK
jgi:hypothetical protein